MNPLDKLVVLYVEDDMQSRMVVDILFRMVLQIPTVTIFENSAGFMERLQALPEKPNLILLDIQMKPDDGYAVLKMIKELDGYNDTVIIALTANVMAHDVEKLKVAGFNGLIGKPIIREIFPELIQMIRNGDPVWYIP